MSRCLTWFLSRDNSNANRNKYAQSRLAQEAKQPSGCRLPGQLDEFSPFDFVALLDTAAGITLYYPVKGAIG
jgi:hypothetical protein